MDDIEEKLPASSTDDDGKELLPQTTFGLVNLNHFGISVLELDRSIAFYRALTGQDPTAIGTWSSIGLDNASGIGNNRSDKGAAIRWATFRINNVNIDLLQVSKEKDPEVSLAKHSLGEMGAMHACFEVEDLEPVFKRMKDAGIKFHGPFHRVSHDEDGADEGVGTVVASFDGPDGERLELIAPRGPFVRLAKTAK
ncbi:MAG TPA: VOC family protein [Nitrososphaera sp.]|nr:VOC family protein [Nitrososphaera sp.]